MTLPTTQDGTLFDLLGSVETATITEMANRTELNGFQIGQVVRSVEGAVVCANSHMSAMN